MHCEDCGMYGMDDMPVILFLFGLFGLHQYLLGVAFPKVGKNFYPSSPRLYYEGIILMLTFVIGSIEYSLHRQIYVTIGILLLFGWLIIPFAKEKEKKLLLRPPVQVQEPTPAQKEENLEVESGRNWTKYLYATSYNSYSYYIC